MKVVVNCSKEQQQEILQKQTHAAIDFLFTTNQKQFIATEGDIFFDLLFDESNPIIAITNQPLFINAVMTTCTNLPDNCIRINGWNGFLQRNVVEICTLNNQSFVDEVMKDLGWNYQLVADLPGMIAPRIIAMIVNEAYFGLQDKISTKGEIDVAMKLGTNYPFGPFEWSEKIGLHKIYELLIQLSKEDSRYLPSLLLEKTALPI